MNLRLKTVHSQSYATFFRYSTVLSVPAVLLLKLPTFVDDGNVTIDKKLGVERLQGAQTTPQLSRQDNFDHGNINLIMTK